jgi:lysozyme
MAETQSTSTITTESTAPTGDIKVFVDTFNKDFDLKLKSLLDDQQNYKNVYADAIKITTPKQGSWPNDPKVVTIGDLFKYTFPDIDSDNIITPPSPSSGDYENYTGWLKDLKNNKDEKISKMYSTISNGIRSNKDIKNYQDLKKPGITNPNLWSPGQYYFDIFMYEILSPQGPLKDPKEANGGGIFSTYDFIKAQGGSVSVSNFDPSGEVDLSKHDKGTDSKLDYYEFYQILDGGYVGSGIKYTTSNITGVSIGLGDQSPDKPVSFTSLKTQYRSGLLIDLDKDPKFNKERGDVEVSTGQFIGNYEHMLLYKAFIQAGDNYKSVVLPYRNPEVTIIPDSNPPLVKVQKPQEVGYIFNVEKKDSFIIVGGSMSGIEFTIVPNDGTTYITNEAPISNIDDEDELGDEYSEGEFLGIEDTSIKIEYVPTIDDRQAVITDTTTLSGPVEITKPKDGSMTISSDGLKRLKKHEGSKATVYDDKTGKGISSWGECAGFPTVGIGHLIQNNEKAAFSKFLKPGKMSDNEIDNLLLKDLQERINALNKKLKVKVSQNQFDALLSMMFNTGGGNKSFLKAVSLTNDGKFKDAAAQIKSGPKTSKGVVLAGLERRRKEESETYLA